MTKIDINQLDEKEEEIADARIFLGLGRLVARTLALFERLMKLKK